MGLAILIVVVGVLGGTGLMFGDYLKSKGY